jgi:hypothetical protein
MSTFRTNASNQIALSLQQLLSKNIKIYQNYKKQIKMSPINFKLAKIKKRKKENNK